jgi:sulfatase maturation enzyme AslB (radical SAM superfamily)
VQFFFFGSFEIGKCKALKLAGHKPADDRSGNMNIIILDGHKLQWHQERIQAWQAGERIAPITIDCSLTRACTYKCVYCYGLLQDNDSKRMTKDIIFRFLDDAVEIGVKAISFVSDGESTSSPHLKDAILRGKSNGLEWQAIGTNGYLLKDEHLEEFLPELTYLRSSMNELGKNRVMQSSHTDFRDLGKNEN